MNTAVFSVRRFYNLELSYFVVFMYILLSQSVVFVGTRIADGNEPLVPNKAQRKNADIYNKEGGFNSVKHGT